MGYLVITLQSVHETMRCEDLLTEVGIAVEIIPTPALKTGDCGVSLKIVEDGEMDLSEIELCGEIKRILRKSGDYFTEIASSELLPDKKG